MPLSVAVMAAAFLVMLWTCAGLIGVCIMIGNRGGKARAGIWLWAAFTLGGISIILAGLGL